MKVLRISASILACFIILVGLYTGLVTGIASLAFPFRAGGSLLIRDGAVRGSTLLGQDFKDPGLFHGRPSASGYRPEAGSGSNLGPTSAALGKLVSERQSTLITENSLPDRPAGQAPADLLFASGSGLDPDISPAAARYQVGRIAAARGGLVSEASLLALIAGKTRPRVLGLLGEERVNVVELNLALLDGRADAPGFMGPGEGKNDE